MLTKGFASLALVATQTDDGGWLIGPEHAEAFENLLKEAGHLYASLAHREAA